MEFDDMPIGVNALIFNDKNQLLLGKRVNCFGEGTFGLIGGKLKVGETIESCIKRELLEEVGICVNIEDIEVVNLSSTNIEIPIELDYPLLINWTITGKCQNKSFTDLLPSEKAAVLVARYEKISSQGKRNDIMQEIVALEEQKGTCGHDVHKSGKSRDGLGEEYGMTGRNIARYMRIDRLIPEFKEAVDKGTLALVAAVDLSYLNVKMQKIIHQVAEAEGKKLKPKQTGELRKLGKEITKEAVEECTGRQGTEETAECISDAASGTV